MTKHIKLHKLPVIIKQTWQINYQLQSSNAATELNDWQLCMFDD